MNKIWVAISIICFFFISSCGGSGSNTGQSLGTAPTISSLSFTPSSILQNSGGGLVDISGQINFSDPDGDIKTLVIVGLSRLDIPISIASGTTSGVVQAVVNNNDTTVKGTFSFEVWIIDHQGNESNRLQGQVQVI